jgi:hypothetical protein
MQAGAKITAEVYNSGLDRLMSTFHNLDLVSYINTLLLKKGRHNAEHGDIFRALSVAYLFSPKLILSTVEEKLQEIESDYKKEPYQSPIVADFFSTRPKINDDLVGRFLDRIYSFGPNEFFYLIGSKLGHPINPPSGLNLSSFGASFTNSAASGISMNFPSFPERSYLGQKYFFLQYSYFESHSLENMGYWITRIPREVVATNMHNFEKKPLESGGYEVEYKGSTIRWIVDKTSKKGSFLDTERLFESELKDAKKALSILKYGQNCDETKNASPLFYDSREELIEALKIWQHNYPHCKLNKDFIGGDDRELEIFYATRKTDKQRGRPSSNKAGGSGSKFIITACPCKVRVKESQELNVPYVVLATNDMKTPEKELFSINENFSPLLKKFTKNRKVHSEDSSSVPVRTFDYENRSGKAITVTNISKKESYACVLAIFDIMTQSEEEFKIV